MKKTFIMALPLIFGFIIDSLLGDPYKLPHPIRLIGNMIAALDKKVRLHFKNLRTGGVFLACTVILAVFAVSALILYTAYHIHLAVGFITESILCYYMIAPRCLRDESMKVCHALEKNDIEGARKAVSMIVGRDTASLDKDGITRAAVETVAENTSDGVTAPMFWMIFGGAVSGCVYKAVNTMDSMIGYKNEKYIDIGRFAAKLDDALNFIPSRFTALLMVTVCPLAKLDGKNAFRIWKRDRRNHESPNSAQTEPACAGALHLRLAGDAYYFGELHKKKYIGDDDRKIESRDIAKVNKLMYLTSVLMLLISFALRIVVLGVLFYE